MVVDYVDEVMNILLWIINMFPDMTETFALAFSWTLFKRALKLSMIMTLCLGLEIHTRFDGLDFVSRHWCVRIITSNS